jgi:hypothetical protein
MTAGFAWLIFAIAFWHSLLGSPLTDLALLRHAQVTQGSITDASQEVGEGDEGQKVWTHTTTYTYQLPNGKRFTKQQEFPGRLRDGLELPISVDVEYLPADPEISRMKGTGSDTGPKWVFRTLLSLGFLTMVVAPGVYLLRTGFPESARKTKGVRGYVIVRILNAAWLVLALHVGDNYVIKFVTCVVCFYGACLAWQWKRVAWIVPFAAFALLFLPLIPTVPLAWEYIAVGAGVFLIATIFLFREKTSTAPQPVSSPKEQKMTLADFAARLLEVNKDTDPAILQELYDDGLRYRDEAGVGADEKVKEILEVLFTVLQPPQNQTNEHKRS